MSVCKDRAVFVEGTETLGYQEPDGLNDRFGEGVNQNETTVQTNPTTTPCVEIAGKV
jgi:hypothetical protein